MKSYRLSWISTSINDPKKSDLSRVALRGPQEINQFLHWVRQHAQSAGGDSPQTLAGLTVVPMMQPEPANLMYLTAEFPNEKNAIRFKELIWQDIFADLCPCGKPFAASVVEETIMNTQKRLIAFDFDSTLINEETIDELARVMGFYHQVAAITENAMQGKLSFTDALKARCKLLTGLHRTTAETVIEKLTLSPGADEFLKYLRTTQARTAIVSGGFQFILDAFQKQLSVDFVLGNTLMQTSDGLFTGEVKLPIIDGPAKQNRIAELKKLNDMNTNQVVCIGDGANDIPMMKEAGISISFCGKSTLTLHCNTWILNRNHLWIKALIS